MKRVICLILILILLVHGCGPGPLVEDAVTLATRLTKTSFEPGVTIASKGVDDIIISQAPRVFVPVTASVARDVETGLKHLDLEEDTVQRIVSGLRKGLRDDNAITNLSAELAQDSACEVLGVGVRSGTLPTEEDRDEILQNRINELPTALLKAYKLEPAQFSFRRDWHELMNDLERKASVSDLEYEKQVYSTIFEQGCKWVPVR
jgi:hypothetical protein